MLNNTIDFVKEKLPLSEDENANLESLKSREFGDHNNNVDRFVAEAAVRYRNTLDTLRGIVSSKRKN